MNTNYINKLFIIMINMLIIITSGTTWQIKSNGFEILLILLLIIFILLNYNRYNKIIKEFNLIILPIMIYLINGVFIYNNIYFKLILKLFLILVFMTIINNKEKKFIFESFYNIIILYSIFNLIIYLLISFNVLEFTDIVYLSDFEKSINKYYYTYRNIFFNWQGKFQFLGFEIMRNSGIFVEAGRYGVFLSLALIIGLIIKDKPSKIGNVILMICIVTTVSTTTIIVSIFIISVKYISIINYRYDLFSKLIIVFLVILISCIFSFFIFNDKLKSQSGVASLDLRLYDMKLAIEYFKEKFLFGWGIGNDKIIKSCIMHGTTVDGNANGLTKVLYQGGIFMTSIYVILFLSLFRSSTKILGKIKGASIFCIVLFQVASQGLIYDNIITYILSICYILTMKQIIV